MIRVGFVLALAGLGGCTLFSGSPPDRSCRSDEDCFRAQGERCNLASHVCEVSIDAATGDAPVTVDAAEVDAAVPIDAAVDAVLEIDAP